MLRRDRLFKCGTLELSVYFGFQLLADRPQGKQHEARIVEIKIPDPAASLEEWQQNVNQVVFQFDQIADEIFELLKDPRSDDAQRSRILAIVQAFSADVTAQRLVKIIDLRDGRGAVFGDYFQGTYPIVTILKNYGAPSTKNGIEDSQSEPPVELVV